MAAAPLHSSGLYPVHKPADNYKKVVDSIKSTTRLKAVLLAEGKLKLPTMTAVTLFNLINTKASSNPLINIQDLSINIYSNKGRSYLHFEQQKLGTGGFKTAFVGLQIIPETYKKVTLLIPFKEKGGLHYEARMHKTLANVEGVLKSYDHFVFKETDVLVVKYCNRNNLFEYVVGRNVPLKQKAYFGAQCYFIIQRLHLKGMTHRDIKLDNFLVDREGAFLHLYLCDLGTVVSDDDVQNKSMVNGTPNYYPPEVFKAANPDEVSKTSNPNRDKWAFGCMLYELISGEELPWAGKDRIVVQNHIRNLKSTEWIDKKKFPPAIYDLLESLLAIDPLKRPSDHEICVKLIQFEDSLKAP